MPKPSDAPSETKPEARAAATKAAAVVADAAAKASGITDFQKRFHQAYLDYVTGLQNLQIDLQKRCGEALTTFAAQLQGDVNSALPPDAYRHYIQALQDAWGREDASPRIAEAHRQFMTALQDANVAIHKSYEEQTRKLSDALQQAWKDVQDQAKELHEHYIQALRDAWSQASAETIDPSSLAAISRTILAAAMTAGAVDVGAR